jgi:hypothetical protein
MKKARDPVILSEAKNPRIQESSTSGIPRRVRLLRMTHFINLLKDLCSFFPGGSANKVRLWDFRTDLQVNCPAVRRRLSKLRDALTRLIFVSLMQRRYIADPFSRLLWNPAGAGVRLALYHPVLGLPPPSPG